ncbi:hypothetical protein [Vibrio diabolicus]|uniref:hypothetical protein n=1 Tax=Vibrio diabolicus TaxID=50719 RepID=UPI0015F68CCE|nr:hypothetical protein [Vibrio diabolicus]
MTLSSQEWHKTFITLMQSNPINECTASFGCYYIDDVSIPYSVTPKIPNNCYAVSPMTLLSGYAEEELHKVKNVAVRWVCKLLINMTKPILSLAGLDQVQTLNNQCLSTNMYSEQWESLNLDELRRVALDQYPTFPLVLRSLNQLQHSHLIQRLEQQQWQSLVTRQVYLLEDWQAFSFNRDLTKDFKLFNDKDWQFKPLATDEEFQRAKALYDMLYLDKYSRNNIQFSTQYLKQASQNNLVHLVGLFYQDEMLATLGIVEIDNDMTCPIFGYDTNKPQSFALYRRISAYTIRHAMICQRRFNMSSGAPAFKRNRKAQPEIEFSYVYIAHLPWYKRVIWKSLCWLTQHFYRPLLMRFQL